MKVLPDYLINIVPELEEAIEELRLSVVDHAYDLLNTLDVDELSSSEVRDKLNILGLAVDRMNENWLPNSKFYRIYALIKNNRTRLNDLKSIINSGGQFEGLWSDEFLTTTEHNYRLIQTLRHYHVSSGIDGYFYVSGDTKINNGSIIDSSLTALSSDILLRQALPAGYTYLYVPWPKPLYPFDSMYFYNVHMLMFDRLHYALDCVNTDRYDESRPASMQIDSSIIGSVPKKLPYWFDYHYLGAQANNTYTPTPENGIYKNKDGDITPNSEYKVNNSGYDNPVKYELDNSCKVLADSNAIFPTNCYMHNVHKTSLPNKLQSLCVYNTSSDIKYYSSENKIAPANTSTIDQYYTLNDDKSSVYRFDLMFNERIQHLIKLCHTKEFRTSWNESSLIFANVQSSNNYSIKPIKAAENSLYYWFKVKQNNNRLPVSESTIKDNDPLISDITFTNYDRATYSKVDKNFVAYFNETSIGSDKQLDIHDASSNILYNNAGTPIVLDPKLNYNILSINKSNGETISSNNTSATIYTNPANGQIFLNCNDDSDLSSASYVIYKSSRFFKFYLNYNQSDFNFNDLEQDDKYLPINVYNTYGDIYNTSVSPSYTVQFKFNIEGIYLANNTKVNNLSLELSSHTDETSPNVTNIKVKLNSYDSGTIPKASYIIASVKDVTVQQIAPSGYTLWLTIVRVSGVATYGAISNITGKGLSESKNIQDSVYNTGIPYALKTYSSLSEAEIDLNTMDAANMNGLINDGSTPSLVTGIIYSRSAAYQTNNSTLAAGATATVYDRASSTLKTGEPGSYTITAIYNSSNTSIYNTDLKLLVRSSDNRLVIINNSSTSISWCYLTYEYDPIGTLELYYDE